MKKYVITAMCITLCAVLPTVFHSIPNLASIVSPMHIPALLCGLICGWPFGIACGLMGPALSSFVTGMPNMAVLPAMMVELAAYGAIAGLLMRILRTKNVYVSLYISLVTAMLAGRVLAGVVRALIFMAGEYSFALWVSSYFVTTLPGIAIQLVLIPIIYLALEKARLIPARSGNK